MEAQFRTASDPVRWQIVEVVSPNAPGVVDAARIPPVRPAKLREHVGLCGALVSCRTVALRKIDGLSPAFRLGSRC